MHVMSVLLHALRALCLGNTLIVATAFPLTMIDTNCRQKPQVRKRFHFGVSHVVTTRTEQRVGRCVSVRAGHMISLLVT